MDKLMQDIKESFYYGYERFKFLRRNEAFNEVVDHSRFLCGNKRYKDKKEDETNVEATYIVDDKDLRDYLVKFNTGVSPVVKHVYQPDGKLVDVC